MGLAGTAPGPLPKHGLVFSGGKPGTFTAYLDNLRIRHANGSTTELWASGKDTKLNKIAESEYFKNIKVLTIPLQDVRK